MAKRRPKDPSFAQILSGVVKSGGHLRSAPAPPGMRSFGVQRLIDAASATVSISASRTTGVAPLGVVFEATITNSGATNNFRDLLWAWDFGESGSGTWGHGNDLVTSRNAATGATAAHLYGTTGAGGSFTATVSCYGWSGNSLALLGTATQDITVTAVTSLNVAFEVIAYYDSTNGALVSTAPWTNATAVDTGGSAISGAALETHLANGVKVIVFRSGDTFELDTSDFNIDEEGPGILGTFGGPTRAVLTSTANDRTIALGSTGGPATDWRITALKIENLLVDGGGGLSGAAIRNNLNSAQNVTIHNCVFGVAETAIQIDDATIAFRFASDPTVQMNNGVFVHDCTFGADTVAGRAPTVTSTSRGSCMRIAAVNMSLQGNDCESHGDEAGVEQAASHTMRVFHAEKSVIAHNRIAHAGVSKVELKFNAIQWGGYPVNNWYPGNYTEKCVISDNEFVRGATDIMVQLQPESIGAGYDERLRDILFERNYFQGYDSQSAVVRITGHRITCRNDIFDMTSDTNASYALYSMQHDADVNGGDACRDCRVLNWTAYDDTASTLGGALVSVAASVNDTRIENGLYVAPNAAGTATVVSDSGTGTTTTTNGVYNSTQLGTEPPTQASHFRLALGSDALNAGTRLNAVQEDYELVDADGSPIHQGAFQTDPA